MYPPLGWSDAICDVPVHCEACDWHGTLEVDGEVHRGTEQITFHNPDGVPRCARCNEPVDVDGAVLAEKDVA